MSAKRGSTVYQFIVVSASTAGNASADSWTQGLRKLYGPGTYTQYMYIVRLDVLKFLHIECMTKINVIFVNHFCSSFLTFYVFPSSIDLVHCVHVCYVEHH